MKREIFSCICFISGSNSKSSFISLADFSPLISRKFHDFFLAKGADKTNTPDLHNLLKFVSLRVHEGAQWEIQQVAKACLEIAKKHFPHSVESYMKHKMEH